MERIINWIHRGLTRELVTFFDFYLRMSVLWDGPEIETNEVYLLYYSTEDNIFEIEILTPANEENTLAHLYVDMLEKHIQEDVRIRVYNYLGHLIFKVL